MSSLSKPELLALTPKRFLAEGYRDARGVVRGELATLWAAAAVEQLRAAGVKAAELGPLVDRLLAATRSAAATWAVSGRAELDAVAREAKGGPSEWLDACVARVRQAEDLPGLKLHAGAVLRLLALGEAATGARLPDA